MSAVLAHFARDEHVAIKLHLMIVPATDMRYCRRRIARLDESNCPYESARLYRDLPWGPLGREQWFLKYWLGDDDGETFLPRGGFPFLLVLLLFLIILTFPPFSFS